MEKDNLYVDIWRADKKGFYDLFQEFTDSKKDSALFICMDTEAIKWKDVERTKYQKFLQKAIKDTGLKALCLSFGKTSHSREPTRKKAPYFLINVPSRKHFGKSHKKLNRSTLISLVRKQNFMMFNKLGHYLFKRYVKTKISLEIRPMNMFYVNQKT